MVQVLKEEIRERIFSAAIEEFYENSYNTARMKDIAQRAGIPTGLIYSYYKNKKDLFVAVVRPVFEEIRYFVEQNEVVEHKQISNLFEEIEVVFILELFKKRKQAIILADKSEGTEFEDAEEVLIKLVEKHIRDNLSSEIKNVKAGYEDFFYHIMADSFWKRIADIFRHCEDINQARNMVDMITKQYLYGMSYFLDE